MIKYVVHNGSPGIATGTFVCIVRHRKQVGRGTKSANAHADLGAREE
jgi:hypothetical protein